MESSREIEDFQMNNASSQPSSSACNGHSKRLKELENVVLQTSLNNIQMEPEEVLTLDEVGDQDCHGSECLNGLPHVASDVSTETTDQPVPECEQAETQVKEEGRTLTDHLNKRLLLSFLDKLNQNDVGLPGIQRLDCAVAGEDDSNRAADEWGHANKA